MPISKPINYRDSITTRSQSASTTTDIQNHDEEEQELTQEDSINNEIIINSSVENTSYFEMTTIQIKKYDGTESPQIWFPSMEAWMKVQNYTEAKMLSALPLLFEGPAALWLQTQPQSAIASLAAFKVAFFDRFGIKDNDMTFMSIKQTITESALSFIERAEKTGLGAPLPECYKVKAAVKGLNSDLRARVIGKEPSTFLELRKAVQLASEELECVTDSPEVRSVNVLAEKFAEMTRDLSETIFQQVNQLQQQKHQQQQHQQQQQQVQHQQQWRQQKPHRHQTNQPMHQQQRRCQGCGKSCTDRTKCPAFNLTCFKCGKIGHIKPVCRGQWANTNNSR